MSGNPFGIVVEATALVAFLLLVAGCEAIPVEQDDGLITKESVALGPHGMVGAPGGQTIYFNSFESAADTVGWKGYGTFQIRDEAPSGGGTHAAFVSGGCIIPHASFSFTAEKDGALVLRSWGKNLMSGGGVIVTNLATDATIHLSVRERDWTFMQSSDTLRSQANDSLRIALVAGGFAASAMLIDELELVRVD